MPRKSSTTNNLLSIADISRHFSLPESTTRYYCKRFADFIPSVGEGRRRRYRHETLDVISTILDEMQKSRTAAAVEEVLHVRFPQNTVAIPHSSPAVTTNLPQATTSFIPASALQLIERQTIALESIAQILHTMILRSSNAEPIGDSSVSHLRKDIDTLRILLDSSEKTQQADLEQLRSWMTKIIRSNKSQSAV